MKTFFKIFLLSLSMLTFSEVVCAKAADEDLTTITKTINNNNLLYTINKDGIFQYSWTFINKDLIQDDININLILNFNSPFKQDIDKLLDSDIKRQYLSFEYHGNLPTDALIKVKVDDNFKNGEHLYLYYYNENKLEYIKQDLIVNDGYIEFKINHCSDYLLTSSIIKNASDNPQNLGFIIVVLMIIIVGLITVTLFQNKNK